jgi:hypothetical protein
MGNSILSRDNWDKKETNCVKTIKVLLCFFVITLLLYGCGATNNPKPGNDNTQNNPPVEESQTGEDLTKLTADELYNFELLRADWTEEQMLKLGLTKEVNDLTGERTYSNEYIKYSFGNIYGNNETPDLVDVYGKTDVQGPRGITVGDTFDNVLKKFPQEKDWRKSVNGEFYGEVSKDSVVPTGLVSEIESVKETKIVIWPQGQVPRLVVFLKNGVVDHYTIYIQNIFD